MAAVVADKYHLKSIHEEIDLVDRKLAHLLKFERFDSEEDRDSATRKLATKRETLVKTALRLAAEGVEFKPSELPRSLRPKEDAAAQAPKIETAEPPAPAAPGGHSLQSPSDSVYAGTALDWQASIAKYIEKRKKSRGAEGRGPRSSGVGDPLANL